MNKLKPKIQSNEKKTSKVNADVRKLYKDALNHSDLTKSSADLNIDWNHEIQRFQENPPSSFEEAIDRVIKASVVAEDLDSEDMQIIRETLSGNPVVKEILNSFIKSSFVK